MPPRHTADKLEPKIRGLMKSLLKRPRGVDEFTALANGVLEEHGSDIRLSRSSAYRFMRDTEAERQAMRETQEAMAAFGRDIGEIPETDSGVVLAEMLRAMMYKVIRPTLRGEGQGLDAQDIMLLSRSLRDTMATVKGSVDMEIKIRERAEKKTKDAAVKAVEKAATEKGLTKDTADTIKALILGVKVPA